MSVEAEKCYEDACACNPDVCGERYTEYSAPIMGQCCARFPIGLQCEFIAAACTENGSERSSVLEEYDQAVFDALCDEWRKGNTSDGFCPESVRVWSEEFEKCYVEACAAKPAGCGEPYGIDSTPVIGKCCSGLPTEKRCKSLAAACKADGAERKGVVDAYGQEGFEAACDGWCEGVSEDWCQTPGSDAEALSVTSPDPGLTAGPIAGIVVGAVAVTGAAAAGIGYFLMLKKPPAPTP
jgi:hypothetical protein